MPCDLQATRHNYLSSPQANTCGGTASISDAVFIWIRYSLIFTGLCKTKAKQNPVHIPHSKLGELAHQAQSAGIFATGEYLLSRAKNPIRRVINQLLSLLTIRDKCYKISGVIGF